MKANKPLKIKILNIAAFTGGFLTAALYAAYFAKLIASPESTLAITATTIVLLGALIPLIAHQFLSKARGKVYTVLEIIYTALAWIFLISFAAMCIYVMSFAKTPPSLSAEAENGEGANTAIIVFGCKVNGTQASDMLKSRVDAAKDVISMLPNAVCVLSGGQGTGELITEASAMQHELGLSGTEILEEKATNTRENIDFSLAALKAENVEYNTLICVSSRFHLARIRLMMQSGKTDIANSINVIYYPASGSAPLSTLVPSLVREYMSYVHYFFYGF